MYIHSTYKLINDNSEASIYRKDLREISKMNLRQSSKFNIIAVLGALRCLTNVSYDKNLSIYLSTQYSCIKNMISVVHQANIKGEIVMPFDFLNVNTNNVGFFIAQTLGTLGNHLNITVQDMSFEKAFELAYFDLLHGEASEALIGGVDESLQDVPETHKLISNVENLEMKDGSCWIFISPKKDGAIATIKAVETYENLSELNAKLNAINYDQLTLNQFARKQKDSLAINQNLLLPNQNEFYGTESAALIISLLTTNQKHLAHISLDAKQRAYLFLLEKV